MKNIHLGVKWTNEDIDLLKSVASIKNKNEILKLFQKRTWTAISLKINILKIDRIKFRNDFKNFIIPDESVDFAWWLGALAGDGHAAFDRIRLKVTDMDFANEFKNIGEKIFGVYGDYKEKVDNDQKIKRKLQYIITFYSQKLSNYLGDWSSLNWDKTLKDRFDWILEDKRYIAAFLSGYFDAEGSVVCKFYKKQYLFRMKYAIEPDNIKLMISDMLERLGVENRVYNQSVSLYGLQNLKRFASAIKLSIKRKQDKLDIIKNIKVKYENEYKLAQEFRAQKLTTNQISKLLDVPIPTIEGWFYKGHKPYQILGGGSL